MPVRMILAWILTAIAINIKTGNVEKGADIAEGYYFEQIRVLDNEDAE